MKAAVLHEVNQPLQMEEIDVALPGPREVLVRTKASGVCHSDLHFVEGLYTTTMPVVLGHEAAGIVEAIGSQVNYVSLETALSVAYRSSVVSANAAPLGVRCYAREQAWYVVRMKHHV